MKLKGWYTFQRSTAETTCTLVSPMISHLGTLVMACDLHDFSPPVKSQQFHSSCSPQCLSSSARKWNFDVSTFLNRLFFSSFVICMSTIPRVKKNKIGIKQRNCITVTQKQSKQITQTHTHHILTQRANAQVTHI